MSRNKNGTLVSEYGVWCEKFGQYRDFTGGFCGDVDVAEDCRGRPANENKGKQAKRSARAKKGISCMSHVFHRGEMS